MNDLISRQALGETMYEEVFLKDSDDQRWDSGCWIRYKMFENVLASAPTIDAVSKHDMKIILEEVTKPKWIPVTERLPEHEYGESTSVLAVDLFGVMRVTYFDGGNWCCPSGEALTTMRVAPITHWMPLPEPPKGEREDDV